MMTCLVASQLRSYLLRRRYFETIPLVLVAIASSIKVVKAVLVVGFKAR